MNSILLLCCSRKEGNPSSNLPRLIESLIKNSDEASRIKLFVKVDEDDAPNGILNGSKLPFETRLTTGPRQNGYTSIHNGYKLLCGNVPETVDLIGAVADDFTAMPHWDTHLREQFEEVSIVHGAPCPLYDFNQIDAGEQYIDEAPFWSRKVLEEVGYNWLSSFTDAWTVAVEYFLREIHGIEITKVCRERLFLRMTSSLDGPDNIRWHTDRKRNFEQLKSPEIVNKLKEQAAILAMLANELEPRV